MKTALNMKTGIASNKKEVTALNMKTGIASNKEGSDSIEQEDRDSIK